MAAAQESSPDLSAHSTPAFTSQSPPYGSPRTSDADFPTLNMENKTRLADDFREVFRLFDSDDDGGITPEEFQRVMEKLGLKQVTLQDAKKIIAKIDTNGDGEVDYSEFVNFWSSFAAEQPVDWNRDLEDAFTLLDLDSSGTIEFPELFAMLQKLEIPISKEELELLWGDVDLNGDGHVDIEEFRKMMDQSVPDTPPEE